MRKIAARLVYASLAAFLVSCVGLAGHAAAAFDKNYLISDSLFSKTSSMSASQIDSFLNTFSSSCISSHNGFSAKKPVGYSATTGKFSYSSGYYSAGVVIKAAADAYDMNPEVLVTTLQKEQSLVSGTAGCSVKRYVGAMGYGCPDGGNSYNYSGLSLYRKNGTTVSSVSGTCVNKDYKAGFAQQLIWGAWLLKHGQQRSLGNVNWMIIRGSWDNSDEPTCYSGPMTRGNFQRCRGGPTVSYDGYSTIDGDSVFMGTGATAALYWYTPHKHGNQSFVSIFEGWFGSTKGLANVVHPDGTLIKSATSPAVFLMKNGQRWNFPNQQSLYSFGYNWGDVKPATDPDMATTVGGTLSYREGALLKGSGPAIFVVDYISGTPNKRAFGSWDVFKTFGYDIKDVQTLPDSALSAITTGSSFSTNSVAHPDGTLVKSSGSPAVFLIQDGQRRNFISPDALFSHGYGWGDVETANSSDMALSLGSSLSFREGTLLKTSSSTIYAVDDVSGTLRSRPFADWATFSGLRYSLSDVVSVPSGQLPSVGTTVGP